MNRTNLPGTIFSDNNHLTINTMNKIQYYALSNGKINIPNLAVILDVLKEKNIVNLDHILEVILGMKDMTEDIPECAVLNKGTSREINARFSEYDILTDTVRYEYDDTLKLWFENEADAQAFSRGDSYYNRKYSYSEREGFTFPGERSLVSGGIVSLGEWMLGL